MDMEAAGNKTFIILYGSLILVTGELALIHLDNMNQQQIKNQNIYKLKITRGPVKPVKPIANDRLLIRFQRILFVREKGYAVINVNVFPASQ